MSLACCCFKIWGDRFRVRDIDSGKKKALRHDFWCEQSCALMQRKWNANLGKDGCLHMQYEHIHELAAVVHGYSLDSALIDEFRPKVTEETVCKCEI